jgi:hypothetical protein
MSTLVSAANSKTVQQMGGSVWKTQDLQMEVSLRLSALAKKIGPGLGGIQLLRGEGDETTELFLLG